ncbi:MAG: CoA transferase [Proteobacteria bacterium]|nr:CoA transferase [Pseudomonadota bacterium]MBU1712773.1 CoA transferase [Pseudomonadota bacterium]
MKKHLEGIRVIDLTAYLSGPYSSMNLAAMGAEVIKVERPQDGDPCRWNPPFAGVHGVSFEKKDDKDISLLYLKRNRNKKSIFLDLKQEEGKEIFRQLVEKSDIVLENFLPGVMDRLGFSYERMTEINPGIIYCSISGYGQSGPLKNRPAFDLTIQATSGIMGLTGFPDGAPVRCGAWIGDMLSSLYSVIGILAAIVSREKTGKGERIDIAMNDACFSMCTDEALDLNISLGQPVRTGNRLLRLAPWNSYQTNDGYVVICVANNLQWHSFLEVIGREDLKSDPRFKDQQDRYRYADDIEEIVESWVKKLTKAEVVERMNQKKVPCEAIAEFDEVLENPQLKHREMIQEVMHPFSGGTGLRAAGFPIKFSRLKTDPLTPAPYPGQHSEGLYREILDIPQEKIEALKKQGVI